ncbi:TraR/DksA family transcriptional regulator [Streptomyces sp. NPDC020965]|uniref:TraR/DksA family transcriptional regulator n=1 Tax=Streptomyces sp. NPDC020965 TaxID=3365105 RepID=UPI0037A2A804
MVAKKTAERHPASARSTAAEAAADDPPEATGDAPPETAGGGAPVAGAKKASGVKKATGGKGAAKKAVGKKAAGKKAVGEKVAVKKAVAKKAAKKSAKKTAAKKTAASAAGATGVPADGAQQTGARTVGSKKTVAARKSATAVPTARAAATAPDGLAVRPGEDPWTPEEVAEARSELAGEVVRLNAELTASEAALAGLMRDSGGGAGDDDADTGTKNITREHELALAASAREMLEQTERALRRLDAGTYGICENCGKPIGKARMQAFPRATLCVECKQKQERRG